MKTKTATIEHYTGFGSPWFFTDVIYRGKRLHHVETQEFTRQEQVNIARRWALANGFTHIIINQVS